MILTDSSSFVAASTASLFTDIICRAVSLRLVSADRRTRVLDSVVEYLLQQVREGGSLAGASLTCPSAFSGGMLREGKTCKRHSQSA
jgi:hypothetical protein